MHGVCVWALRVELRSPGLRGKCLHSVASQRQLNKPKQVFFRKEKRKSPRIQEKNRSSHIEVLRQHQKHSPRSQKVVKVAFLKLKRLLCERRRREKGKESRGPEPVSDKGSLSKTYRKKSPLHLLARIKCRIYEQFLNCNNEEMNKPIRNEVEDLTRSNKKQVQKPCVVRGSSPGGDYTWTQQTRGAMAPVVQYQLSTQEATGSITRTTIHTVWQRTSVIPALGTPAYTGG